MQTSHSGALTLVVLAAGMGTRFGGLKQMEPLGPGGETVLEYSVFDAVRAGFSRVVFVVRRGFVDAFRTQVVSKFGSRIGVDYAFQELDSLPEGCSVPEGRTKPWGTGHAVLVARQLVPGPFAVINADDFYGPAAFASVATFLKGIGDTWPARFCLIAYKLGNTLSPNGTVSRGVCSLEDGSMLARIEEREKIRSTPGGPEAAKGDGWEPLPADIPVSMNLMGFSPQMFQFLEEQFQSFIQQHGEETGSEFYLPAAVATMIHRGQAKVEVIHTDEKWMGITYPEDRAEFRAAIAERIKLGDYPEPLWQ